MGRRITSEVAFIVASLALGGARVCWDTCYEDCAAGVCGGIAECSSETFTVGGEVFNLPGYFQRVCNSNEDSCLVRNVESQFSDLSSDIISFPAGCSFEYTVKTGKQKTINRDNTNLFTCDEDLCNFPPPGASNPDQKADFLQLTEENQLHFEIVSEVDGEKKPLEIKDCRETVFQEVDSVSACFAEEGGSPTCSEDTPPEEIGKPKLSCPGVIGIITLTGFTLVILFTYFYVRRRVRINKEKTEDEYPSTVISTQRNS